MSVDKNKIAIIVEQLDGLTSMQWSRIKQVVDSEFSYRAAKVTLDDPKVLKQRLEVEFNLRRYADESD